MLVESHIELALTSIVHGAQLMARALRRVGGAHRAPSGPRRARRSRSLFAVLRHMYRKCVNDSCNEPRIGIRFSTLSVRFTILYYIYALSHYASLYYDYTHTIVDVLTGSCILQLYRVIIQRSSHTLQSCNMCYNVITYVSVCYR